MAKQDYVLAEDPGVDLAVVEVMAEELEAYLVDDELYRQLLVRTPSGDQRPQMTGGDLLTRLYRLTQEQKLLSPEERGRLKQAQTRVEDVSRALRSRFHERLAREVRARINSLRWFLDDCRQDRARCHTEYVYEIRNRQRIEEILKEVAGALPKELAAALDQIDRQLEQLTNATSFIWDERLETIFPRSTYWYLYRRPPAASR